MTKRRCCICGEPMACGYVIDEDEYFCSDGCLHDKYTAEEYDHMYRDDIGYWTQWESDEVDE